MNRAVTHGDILQIEKKLVTILNMLYSIENYL